MQSEIIVLHELFQSNNPAEIEAGLKVYEGLSDEEKRALLSQKNISGNTPLHFLFENANPAAIKAGLEAFSGLSGQDKMMALLSEKNISGYTPLHVLFRFNNPAAIKAGLEAFLKDNLKDLVLLQMEDKYGNTPLHLLFKNKNPAAIKAFAEAFSDCYEYNSYKRFTKALPYLFLGAVFLGLGLVSELCLKGMKFVSDHIKGQVMDVISGLLVALAIIALVYPMTNSFKAKALGSAIESYCSVRNSIADYDCLKSLRNAGFTLKQNKA